MPLLPLLKAAWKVCKTGRQVLHITILVMGDVSTAGLRKVALLLLCRLNLDDPLQAFFGHATTQYRNFEWPAG